MGHLHRTLLYEVHAVRILFKDGHSSEFLDTRNKDNVSSLTDALYLIYELSEVVTLCSVFRSCFANIVHDKSKLFMCTPVCIMHYTYVSLT